MNKFQQPPPFQNTILRKSYIVGICHFPNKINKRMKMVLPFLLLLVLVSLPKIYWMVIMLQHCITSFTLGSACPVSGKSSETTTGIDFLLHFQVELYSNHNSRRTSKMIQLSLEQHRTLQVLFELDLSFFRTDRFTKQDLVET